MKKAQLLGIVIFVVGAILLGFAYHSSNAPVEQLTNTFTGRYSDQTTWYFVLGAAAAIGGGLLFVFGLRK
jgi:drug/metabolite transporter (DMT)-like permease